MNLPILKILAGAVVLFWERRVVLVRVLWAPILIGLILSLLSASLAGDRGGGLSAVLLLVPLLFVTAILAVRAHRVYLLGSESVAELPPLSWSQTETRFLLATLSLGLAFLGLMFFAGMVFTLAGARPPGSLNPGAMLIALPAMYVIARLLPALPAIAVGDETGLADAWRKAWTSSRGNGTRVLAPLAIKVLLELFATAPIPGTAVISTLAGWAVMPAEVALLSLTYQALRSSESETPQQLEQ
jgi:hypothetical protein